MRVWTVALAGLMTVAAGCRQAPPAEQSGSGAPAFHPTRSRRSP